MPPILFLPLPGAGEKRRKPARQLKRDDLATYDGRLYFLRGFDPMGVLSQRAYLEDAETHERRTVPLADLVDRRHPPRGGASWGRPAAVAG